MCIINYNVEYLWMLIINPSFQFSHKYSNRCIPTPKMGCAVLYCTL